VAFQEDAFIFNVIFYPLIIEKEGSISKKPCMDEESSSLDHHDNSDFDVPKIQATNLFCM